MILLSGIPLRDKILEDVRRKVFSDRIFPELAIIQVGDNLESDVYIKQKQKFGDEVGMIVRVVRLEENVAEDLLIEKIKELNNSEEVSGIIVQLPLPKGFDKNKIIDSIDPKKDVDGLSSFQKDLLKTDDKNKILPATAMGVMSLLNFYDISVSNKKVAVIGYSDLVGKPISILCEKEGAKVSVCDENTKNIKEICSDSDVLIVACGVPKLIDGGFVKNGAIVIDVGIHRINGAICGDVDFDSVKDIVSAITPVPGGVGPVTVASLFQNVILAYDCQH